jgi:hypothetical protein
VGADVFDRIELAFEAEDGDLRAVDLYHPVGAWRKLGRATDGNPVTHVARVPGTIISVLNSHDLDLRIDLPHQAFDAGERAGD